jgi:vacuolar-type H+-ATPase subunit I/STV1
MTNRRQKMKKLKRLAQLKNKVEEKAVETLKATVKAVEEFAEEAKDFVLEKKEVKKPKKEIKKEEKEEKEELVTSNTFNFDD